MGTKEEELRRILAPKPTLLTPAKPRYNDMAGAGFEEEVTRIYQALGGILDNFPDRTGPWDIVLDSHMVIELDEERHFNHYRLITLGSPIYKELSGFVLSSYVDYCKMYEQQCLASAGFGGYWTNTSAERQFGPSAERGVLAGDGAPRWKQRAFYDFLKDLSPLVTGVKVIRVAKYDQIEVPKGGMTVVQILEKGTLEDKEVLRRAVLQRLDEPPV